MNMALDSVLWKRARENPEIAILRFYTWRPPGVSLGANQQPAHLVDESFCRAAGIPVVRRVTGGSAIFHDREITYSFTSVNDEHFAGPMTAYEKICDALRGGLVKLGVCLDKRGFSLGREPSFTRQDCFSLSSRHDLVINGRKLIGSAQRKDKTSFLQHGSLLLKINKDLWSRIFLNPPVFEKVTSLSEFMHVPPESEIVKALISGFEEFFGARFMVSTLTSGELEEARRAAPEYRLV